MENNSFFEGWLKNQQQALTQYMDTAKTLAEVSIKGETNPQAYSDILNGYWKNQQAQMEAAFPQMKAMTGFGPFQGYQFPSMGQNPMMQGMTAEGFQTLQKQWMETVQKNLQSFLPNNSPMGNVLGETMNAYQKWNNLFGGLMNDHAGKFMDMKHIASGDFNKSALDSVVKAGEVYVKMFETFSPMADALKKASEQATGQLKADTETMMRAISPERYKEVVDQIFGFMSPSKMQEYYLQIVALSKTIGESGGQFQGQFGQNWKEWQDNFLNPTNDVAGKTVSLFTKQIEGALAPVMKLVPAGKEQEMVSSIKEVQDKYIQFINRYQEMQQLVYGAAFKAIQKTGDELVGKFKNSQELPKYQEFYNHWLNATESIMIETFSTDEFSKAQGEVMNLGLQIRAALEKQVENALAPYPVLTRKEADEMLETLQALKDKVRKLERALSEQEGEDATLTDLKSKGGSKAKAAKSAE